MNDQHTGSCAQNHLPCSLFDCGSEFDRFDAMRSFFNVIFIFMMMMMMMMMMI